MRSARQTYLLVAAAFMMTAFVFLHSTWISLDRRIQVLHGDLHEAKDEELGANGAHQPLDNEEEQEEVNTLSSVTEQKSEYPTISELIRPSTTASTNHLPDKPLIETSPSTPLPDRVVVMAHLKSEDTAWAVSELPTWQYAIYSVDDPFSSLHTFLDKGKEAIAYLTYIIDHYDSLPSTIVFLHAHRSRWPQARHNEGAQCSAVQMLRDLNIDYIHKEGYANLRCNTNPGCPDEIQPFREPKEDRRAAENAMADAWRELFPGNDMHVPVVIATPCGAQFAVSKVQVRKRPRDDYVRFREWVVNTTVEDPGRVMEYLWHVIFGREAVHCPDQRKC